MNKKINHAMFFASKAIALPKKKEPLIDKKQYDSFDHKLCELSIHEKDKNKYPVLKNSNDREGMTCPVIPNKKEKKEEKLNLEKMISILDQLSLWMQDSNRMDCSDEEKGYFIDECIEKIVVQLKNSINDDEIFKSLKNISTVHSVSIEQEQIIEQFHEVLKKLESFDRQAVFREVLASMPQKPIKIIEEITLEGDEDKGRKDVLLNIKLEDDEKVDENIRKNMGKGEVLDKQDISFDRASNGERENKEINLMDQKGNIDSNPTPIFKKIGEKSFSQEPFFNQEIQQNEIHDIENIKVESNFSAKPKFLNILQQITEKTEILLNHDKSEMILHLKPDHLGKLSMRIQVEKDIVMANFIAENYKVKEILESNLNLLKDALQEKGLSVQQCSVSVGNESNFNRQKSFASWSKKDKPATAFLKEMGNINTGEDEEWYNPSLLSLSSTINFLA